MRARIALGFGIWCEQHRRRNRSGLGSSHTAPCGAAVPARPPTRCNKLLATRISVNGPSEPEDRVRRS